MKKIIAFDLDKTLAQSKSNLEHDMVIALKNLLSKYLVAIVSGGNFEQFEKQVLSYLKLDSNLASKLHLFPTCGTQYYKFGEGKWERVYIEGMADQDVKRIVKALECVVSEEGLNDLPSWGERIENRANSQVTLSALGQQAPVDEKSRWDPDKSKRLRMRSKLQELIPEFDIKIGGASSIDITKPGIDKAYGVRKMMEYLNLEIEEILFLGDELEEEGNDYPVKAMGVECIKTNGPEHTLEIISEIIS